jgi:N-acetylglucosamine-6-phosphate deacetylase
MLIALRAAHAVTPERVLPDPVLLAEDGRIVRLGATKEVETPPGARVHDFGDAVLAPAFFDVHIHGSAGHDVMQDSPSGQRAMCEFLARHGTARFLATTMTAPMDATLRALEHIAGWIEASAEENGPRARPVGIHLEGPFLSHAKCGAQPSEHIQPPSIEVFERFWQVARGHIRLMTIAPELPGALDLIRHAAGRGVRVSLGHSDATAKQARAGIAAGAESAAHTFNAMRGFTHREPGMLGTVLDSRELYAELICDGHHVAPEATRLFAAAKPRDRRILITDAISATGRGDGEFALGQLHISVEGDRASLNGKLAGSVLTLDGGVQRFVSEAGVPVDDAAMAASANPAAMLGLPGGMQVGARADLVVLGKDGVLQATFLNGELVEL